MLGKVLTALQGAKEEGFDDVYAPDGSPDPGYLNDANSDATLPQSEGDTKQQNVAPPAGTPTVNPDIAALTTRLDNLDQRNRDKDRYIGKLEGQVSTLSDLVTQLPQIAGSPPAEAEGDPPLLDKDTMEMFTARFAENPADAVAALVEHVDTRAKNHILEARQADQAVADRKQQMQTAQNSIFTQLNRAVGEFGDPARILVEEFMQSTDASETAIGRMLAADQGLALTQSGVYSGVGNLILQAAASANAPATVLAQEQPGTTTPPTVPSGVPVTAGAERQVGVPPVAERPVEDRIGDTIVNAGNHLGNDKLRTALLS